MVQLRTTQFVNRMDAWRPADRICRAVEAGSHHNGFHKQEKRLLRELPKYRLQTLRTPARRRPIDAHPDRRQTEVSGLVTVPRAGVTLSSKINTREPGKYGQLACRGWRPKLMRASNPGPGRHCSRCKLNCCLKLHRPMVAQAAIRRAVARSAWRASGLTYRAVLPIRAPECRAAR